MLSLLLGLSLLIGSPAGLGAQASRGVSWEHFDLAIELLPDSTLRFAHSERVRFEGTFQHAFREIPLERLSSVTEVLVGEPGRPYRSGYNRPETFAVSRNENRLRIDWWFPPTSNSARTFELRYRVSGRVQVYPEGDQFYWIAVPAGLQGAVEAANVTVRLPDDAPVERAASRFGSRWDQVETTGSNEVRFTVQDLPPDQDFEVRVQFPHGLIAATPPPWQQAYDRQAWYDSAVRPVVNLVLLVLSLLIVVGGLLALLLVWRERGRDPVSRSALGEVDSPPSKLTPGLVGTVVDERADVQDVLSTLIDLGNRGIIRITETRDPTLQGSDLDYQLELLQEQPLGLRPYEKTVIGALFGSATEVRLSQVKDRWSVNIPLFQQQLYEEAVREGLFQEDPQAVRRRWRVVGLAVLVGAAVVGLLAQGVLGGLADLVWLPFAALAVVALVMLYAGPRMPRRTKAGVVEAERWRAFARHLAQGRKRPDEARPDEITRHLPYAVALGVDRTWLEKFEAVGRPTPGWASGGNGPIVILGPGGWGFPGPYVPGPWDGDWSSAPQSQGNHGVPVGPAGPSDWGSFPGGLNEANRSWTDLLNAANEALSSGGDSGWSGGGGDFGGGGGDGGSGGFD